MPADNLVFLGIMAVALGSLVAVYDIVVKGDHSIGPVPTVFIVIGFLLLAVAASLK